MRRMPYRGRFPIQKPVQCGPIRRNCAAYLRPHHDLTPLQILFTGQQIVGILVALASLSRVLQDGQRVSLIAYK